MPVSRMTNLRPNDTWKMKIFSAPCRERFIKMKGQAVSSCFVSSRWTFFISTLFFSGWGQERQNTLVVHGRKQSFQPLHPNAGLTKALMLWEKSWPSLLWQEPREMLGKQAADEIRAGGGSPRARCSQSSWAAVFISPSSSLSTGDVPPARGRMVGFVLSWWSNLFSKEKKELGSNQEELIKKFIRDELNKAINLELTYSTLCAN